VQVYFKPYKSLRFWPGKSFGVQALALTRCLLASYKIAVRRILGARHWQDDVASPGSGERQLYQRRFFFKTYSGKKTYTTHDWANRLPAVTSYSEL
jgi:hypothetical protein